MPDTPSPNPPPPDPAYPADPEPRRIVLQGISPHRGTRSEYYHFDHLGKRRLIFSRKEREGLRIGDAVDLLVLEISYDTVKLGITGADHIHASPDL
jgi:hypothetical protein